jgi:hypothetical protein
VFVPFGGFAELPEGLDEHGLVGEASAGLIAPRKVVGI